VRIERGVVLAVLGRLSIVLAVVRPVVVVMLGLLVRPEMRLVIETAVGTSALGLRSRRMRVIPARGVARRMARPLAPAELCIAGGRRRVVRLLLPLA
jgi:hypothetical protein